MKQKNIIYTGKTRKGTDIIIRYPAKADVGAMLSYINTLSEERTFILFQGEQLTLKEEKKHLTEYLKKIKEHKAVVLLVFHHDMLIGEAQIGLKEKAEKHVGSLGISVAKGYRGEGIGKLLMRYVLQEAKKNLPGLTLCVLGMCEGNDIAHQMYKTFGFSEYGRLPEGLKYRGRYVDHVYLFKRMKSGD